MGEVTASQVCTHMGVDLLTLAQADAEHLDAVVAAVNAMVPRTVPTVRAMTDPGDPWADDVQQAAVMQGARLFARRNSPTGVVGYTDAGPAYVARWDPDLERLLGIGSWAPPQAR